MQATTKTLEWIERLVGFDTTSRNSNLALIEEVRGYLSSFGIDSSLSYDRTRTKANLWATIGASDLPGVVLSGHTDVVPVDGQDWETDPYRVEQLDGKLFGRGTADMKGYLAACLALAPEIARRNLETPVHFSLSYDEEVGCIGVRGLIAELEQRPVKPKACLIGEPTSMEVVNAHKGKLSQRCCVTGLESHSGLAHRGVNAVEAAAEAIAYLKTMARRFRDSGPFDDGFDPPYTTVHTGVIEGGTALNIVPRECQFQFEFRCLPGQDPEELAQELRAYVKRELLPEMRAVSRDAGFEWQEMSAFPGLSIDVDDELVRLTQRLAGSNTTGKVSFGTEGGLFQQAGIPSVVCGPGSIRQAHRPNEYIELEQIARCEAFLIALLDDLS